jgi:aldehyde dehydrogenase (NAD(P)+)
MSIAVSPQGTDVAVIERALSDLHERRTEWARLDVRQKIALLERVRTAVGEVADEWIIRAADAKGIDPESPLAVEEWLTGPWALLFAINHYLESLRDIADVGTPRLPKRALRTRHDGQLAVRVFPHRWYDHVLLGGITAEVWMERGVTAENLAATMAVFYKEREPEGAVALVLGAGNIASIAPLDVLDKLIVEGRVCILKLNPVNEYLGPLLARVFASLVERGYVRIVYGGADVGELLSTHPLVEEIHVTGSERTYDAILFGTGPEGEARKQRNEPRLHKRLTGELGNVSPTIVCPGRWSDADLRYQAMNVATQKLLNDGFNCVATQVLVLPKEWPQADVFLGYVRDALRRAPDRPPYYPGADERVRRISSTSGSVESMPSARGLRVLVTGINPDSSHELFETEAFGPVLAETRLPGHDLRTYLDAAVRFANTRLRGTLGANVILHPDSERALGSAFEDAIARLEYGCVGINVWSAAGFLMAPGTWGAFPGHTPTDIQSGVGIVHNARMFSRAQRTVVRGAFQPFPRGVLRGDFSLLPYPPWFLSHARGHEVGRRMVQFELEPGARRLPGIVFAALRA